ncbi:nucleoside-diphosphate kinase [Agrobacterium sp. 22-226-1]
MDILQFSEHFFSDQSEFIQTGKHQEYLENNLVQNFTLEQLQAAKKMLLIMLKPDALASGKALPIIQKIIDSDLEIVSWKLLQRVEEWQFEELYKFNLSVHNPKSMIGSWWISRQGYGFSSAILLIARSRSADFTAYEVMSRIKGPSIPYAATPGQIRHDFNAPSRPLNFIHCSDEPLSTLREWQIFSTPPEIAAVLNQADRLEHWKIPQQIKTLIPKLYRRETDACFPSAIVRTAMRMALTIAAEEARAIFLVSMLETITLGPGGPSSKITSLTAELLVIKDKIATTDFTAWKNPDLVHALLRFMDFLALSRTSFTKSLSLFHHHGMATDRWDELMIETNLHYKEDLLLAFRPMIGTENNGALCEMFNNTSHMRLNI